MLIVPLTAVVSQKLSVLLAKQNCQIAVYQKSTGLYIDLSVNNVPVVQANLCKDRVHIAPEAYLGFVGTLRFVDTIGALDPVYSGLGSRYLLVYE
jgi:hypothetical protein